MQGKICRGKEFYGNRVKFARLRGGSHDSVPGVTDPTEITHRLIFAQSAKIGPDIRK